VKRGDLYRVTRPGAGDPKRSRVFAVVSRQPLIDSQFSTVVCVPVYSARYGLSTEVPVGVDEGLRAESSLHCDALVSLQKSMLTGFVGSLSPRTLVEVDRAIARALDLDLDALCDETSRT
jgi:mRNA interferase MazF